jgi:hypothetical protein
MTGNVDMPATFKQNGRQVDIQVSSQSGKTVIARWIRIMGNREVVVRAGESQDKLEYIVSLYLKSKYS